MPTIERSSVVKVADEVFIATALLHREHPEREDFTIGEIVERAERENLFGKLRPGVRVHATLHCVANLAPNPGRYRMLFGTGKHTRRLLRSTDEVHPDRDGKIWPDPQDVPEPYVALIEWARQRYGTGTPRRARGVEALLELRGMGKDLWRDEDPDGYVRKLREDWG